VTVSDVTPINRTLDQEILALLRGASLECPVCGEFVLRRHRTVECPECGSALRAEEATESGLQFTLQAG
jgi:predicted RNA-binding Zn-ribbon protein involved in translation (DUF1610 family)